MDQDDVSTKKMENTLADLSKRDAIHDFGTLINSFFSKVTRFITGINIFNQGLPEYDANTSIVVPSGGEIERDGFLSIIEKLEKDGKPVDKSSIIDTYYKEAEKTDEKKYTITTIFGKSYTMNSIVAKTGSGSEREYITAQQLTDGLITEPNTAIIIDAFSISLLSILKSGDPLIGKNVYYLYTPEVANDPAPKTALDDSIFNKSGGVELIPCVTVAPASTIYTYRWDPAVESAYNKFFSKYDFQLSELQKLTLGKTVRYSSNLLIKDQQYKFVEKADEGNKAKNSIGFLESMIKNLIDDVITKFKTLVMGDKKQLNPIFSFNAKVQQKRSGDWLQALACLNVANKSLLLKKYGESTEPLGDIGKVYLVTHDFILLAFALSMGVNVLFTHSKSKRIYKFEIQDPEAENATLTEKMKNIKHDKPYESAKEEIEKYIDGYNEWRNQKIQNNIEVLNTEMEKPVDINTEIKTTFNEYTRKVFIAALVLAHTITILPDIDVLFKQYTEYYKSFVDKIEAYPEDGSVELKDTKDINNEYERMVSKHNQIKRELEKYVSYDERLNKVIIIFDLEKTYTTFLREPCIKLLKEWDVTNKSGKGSTDVRMWSSLKIFFNSNTDKVVPDKKFVSDRNMFLYMLGMLPEETKEMIVDKYGDIYKKMTDEEEKENTSRNVKNIIVLGKTFCTELFATLHVNDTNKKMITDVLVFQKNDQDRGQEAVQEEVEVEVEVEVEKILTLTESSVVEEHNKIVELENENKILSTLYLTEKVTNLDSNQTVKLIKDEENDYIFEDVDMSDPVEEPGTEKVEIDRHIKITDEDVVLTEEDFDTLYEILQLTGEELEAAKEEQSESIFADGLMEDMKGFDEERAKEDIKARNDKYSLMFPNDAMIPATQEEKYGGSMGRRTEKFYEYPFQYTGTARTNEELSTKQATYSLMNMLLFYLVPVPAVIEKILEDIAEKNRAKEEVESDDEQNAPAVATEEKNDNEVKSSEVDALANKIGQISLDKYGVQTAHVGGTTSVAIFHPLLPIYMITEALNDTIKYHVEDMMEYDLYVNYLNYLKKMSLVLENEESPEKRAVLSYGIRSLLFTHDVLNMSDEITDIYGLTQDEYMPVSLLTSLLRHRITGMCVLTSEETDLGMTILKTPFFIDFMTNVGLKELFTIKPETEEDIDSLKENTYDFLIDTGKKIIDSSKNPTEPVAATEPVVAEEEPAEEPVVAEEEPTVEPVVAEEEPAEEPTVEPAEEPTVEPAEEPTVEPTTAAEPPTEMVKQPEMVLPTGVAAPPGSMFERFSKYAQSLSPFPRKKTATRLPRTQGGKTMKNNRKKTRNNKKKNKMARKTKKYTIR
jgi:hypothetical protein